MYFHLVALGCQMNISESERIAAVLKSMGYRHTDNERIAEILGVVACSVRQKAIDRVYSKIQLWNSWKQRRSLLTFATGCILPADKKKMLKLFDLIFGIQQLSELPQMIQQYGVPIPHTYEIPVLSSGYTDDIGIVETAEHRAVPSTTTDASTATAATASGTRHLSVRPHYSSHIEAYLPIQNGCDKFCTFCAVPYTRGREVSRASDEIYSEVEYLLSQDYKTITLLGQNVNSYGLDKPGSEATFPELLRTIAVQVEQSKKECLLYFTSPHPRDFTNELLEVMATYSSIAKQVHLPLQSGDDKVLIRMNRNYSMERYRSLVHAVRDTLPTATLFTDIIVGFCGETDVQFENTRSAMQEFKYNMAYIAAYSPRPGAASERWQDTVDITTKKQRLAQLSLELQRTAFAHNAERIGTVNRVLINSVDKHGRLLGRTEGRINIRLNDGDQSLIGQYIDMTVTGAKGLSLEGKLAHSSQSMIGETPHSALHATHHAAENGLNHRQTAVTVS